MAQDGSRDGLRQAAVIGAVVGGILSGTSEEYGDAEESLSRVLPADWAFAIWAPIFAGWLAYAAHQARPSRRADPLLRRTGWPVAVTTGVAGTWVRLQRRPLLQLPVIAGTTAAAVTAYARAVPASDEQARSPVDRWVVREPVGLTAGWLTLAAVAATTEVLLAIGCRDLWPGERVWGVGMLAAAGAIATTVTLRLPISAGYPAAVTWGLVATSARELPRRPASGIAAATAAVTALTAARRTAGAAPEVRGRPAPTWDYLRGITGNVNALHASAQSPVQCCGPMSAVVEDERVARDCRGLGRA